MNLNKVLLVGNLTRDPELKTLPSGTQVASFGLATNRVWRDQSGNRKEDTQFHNVVVFGRQAEVVSQYLRKGSTALVEGRLQTRSWDAQDGSKRTRTEVVAERVQFGARSGSQGGAPTGSASAGTSTRQASGSKPAEEIATIEYPEDEINPEDIPF